MALVTRQIVTVAQVLKHRQKGPAKGWGQSGRAGCDVRIAGHLVNAKQAVGVVVALRPLHVALVGQKRRRLHEEDGKGTQSRIRERVIVSGRVRYSGNCVTVPTRIERKRSKESFAAIGNPLQLPTNDALILTDIPFPYIWNC